MFRSPVLCALARRVLLFVVALAFLSMVPLASPQAGIGVADDAKNEINLFDHVWTERLPAVSPDG